MVDAVTVELAPFGRAEDGTPNRPHATQQRIFAWADAVQSGTHTTLGIPVLYAQGGWRSGKTRACLTVLLEALLAYPGLRVLIGRKDFNDLRLSTMVSWEEIRPRELVAEVDKQEHRERWINGSQVFFRELKDLEGLGGQEFGMALVSEPYELEYDLYIRLKGRLSQQGVPHLLLLEGNPPNEGHWLHTLVVGSAHQIKDPDVTFLTVPTDENWANLSDDYKHTITSSPAAWQQKYRLGLWGFTPEGTPVYPAFIHDVHVRPTTIIPDRPLLRGWDFGLRRAACVWAQRTDAGQLLVHKEWLAIETPEEDFITGVILRTNEWFGAHTCVDAGDPAATQRDPAGVSTLTRLSRQGIHLRYRQDEATRYGARIPLLNRKFCELVHGAPAIILDPACRTLIEGLAGGYHYPKIQQGQEYTHKRDLPFRDGWYEHLANAFEYLCLDQFLGASATTTAAHRARRLVHREHVAGRRGVVSF